MDNAASSCYEHCLCHCSYGQTSVRFLELRGCPLGYYSSHFVRVCDPINTCNQKYLVRICSSKSCTVPFQKKGVRAQRITFFGRVYGEKRVCMYARMKMANCIGTIPVRSVDYYTASTSTVLYGSVSQSVLHTSMHR